MITVNDVALFLEDFAPSSLAEEWDNVGLLVGHGDQEVRRLMTCLTLTPATVQEAVQRGVDLVVVHHPLPFRPLKRLTTETHDGRLLLDLIAARISVYSAHTAFDSASDGINQSLADGLGLQEALPLVSNAAGGLGAGRYGNVKQPTTLKQLADQVKHFLNVPHVQIVGAPDRELKTVAVACGSAGELLQPARELGCHCLVTGEMRFHGCLEAEASQLCLILAGHYASERFALEQLATVLAKRFSSLEVWASRDERDPLVWI